MRTSILNVNNFKSTYFSSPWIWWYSTSDIKSSAPNKMAFIVFDSWRKTCRCSLHHSIICSNLVPPPLTKYASNLVSKGLISFFSYKPTAEAGYPNMDIYDLMYSGRRGGSAHASVKKWRQTRHVFNEAYRLLDVYISLCFSFQKITHSLKYTL